MPTAAKPAGTLTRTQQLFVIDPLPSIHYHLDGVGWHSKTVHGENNSADACSAGDISFSYFGQSGQSRDVMSHEPVLVKALDMEWSGTLPCYRVSSNA